MYEIYISQSSHLRIITDMRMDRKDNRLQDKNQKTCYNYKVQIKQRIIESAHIKT